MTIVPHTQPLDNPQSVPYEVFQREREKRLQAERQLESHRQTLEGFYQIIHQPNTKLAPGEKLLLIAARCILPDEKPNEKGLVRLPYDKAATFIGMSESSTNRYGNAVTKRYDATHEPVEYTTKKGQDCILTYVNRDDPLWNEPWNIDLPEEKKRPINGNGKYCERCKTNNLKVSTHRITYQEVQECECCGYTKVSEVLDDHEPLTPGEYIPEKKGLQAGEPFLEEQELEKALTSASLTPITTQDQRIFEQDPEIEKGLQAGEPFSVEDFLQRRIGHGPIIWHTGSQVNTDSDPKYYTKLAEYVPDIKAYLRGDVKHIYGSRPALPDGTTYLLGFDIEDPALDKSHKYMMFRLASAGISSVYWKRRPGRGHLEIYTDRPVESKAFYAYAVRVCPDLAQVPEVFPIDNDQNDRSDYGYSWPLYYRIENKVIECSAEFMFPDRPGELVASSGYQSDRAGLEHLLSRAIVDAALIPALRIYKEAIATQPADVVLLDKPLNRSYRDGDDLKPIVLDEWNRTHSWDEVIELCGGVQKNKHFLAKWRSERTASVKVDPDGRYACDYGSKRGAYPKKLDKFGVYCLAMELDQTQEINRLCAEYRQLSRQQRRAS